MSGLWFVWKQTRLQSVRLITHDRSRKQEQFPSTLERALGRLSHWESFSSGSTTADDFTAHLFAISSHVHHRGRFTCAQSLLLSFNSSLYNCHLRVDCQVDCLASIVPCEVTQMSLLSSLVSSLSSVLLFDDGECIVTPREWPLMQGHTLSWPPPSLVISRK